MRLTTTYHVTTAPITKNDAHQDMEIVGNLLQILRPFQCPSGSVLFTKAEAGEAVMFVVTKGELTEMFEETAELAIKIKQGMCVGEMYAFGIIRERITTVIAQRPCEMFELSVKELRRFLCESPQLLVQMRDEARDKLYIFFLAAPSLLSTSAFLSSRRSSYQSFPLNRYHISTVYTDLHTYPLTYSHTCLITHSRTY